MTTQDKDKLIAKLQEATSENEAGRHGVANMLIQDARAILYSQPAPASDEVLAEDYNTRPGGGGLGDVPTFSAVAKAVSYLYIQLPEQVADDVNAKFNAFIGAVVTERTALLARVWQAEAHNKQLVDACATVGNHYSELIAEAPKWIAAEEGLPERDLPVLFCIESGAKKVGAYTLVRYSATFHGPPLERWEWEVNSEEGYEPESVTHWQPLPAAPTVKGGQPNA